MPEYFEIKIKGQLDPCWSEWFAGLKLTHLEGDGTLLSGMLHDSFMVSRSNPYCRTDCLCCFCLDKAILEHCLPYPLHPGYTGSSGVRLVLELLEPVGLPVLNLFGKYKKGASDDSI